MVTTLRGCAVSLDQIALIIQAALTRQGSRDQELLELHEKATEAMQLLLRRQKRPSSSGPANCRLC